MKNNYTRHRQNQSIHKSQTNKNKMKKLFFLLLFTAICGLSSYSQIGQSGTITIHATPTTTVCANTQVILTTTLSNGLPANGTYQWTLHTVPIQIISTSSSYSFNASTSTTFYVTYTYTGGSVSSSITITVIPLPAIPIITGENAICTTGVPITFTLPNYGLSTNWTYVITPIGGNFSNIPSVNSSGQFTVIWANNTATAINIIVNDASTGCHNSYSFPIYSCCNQGVANFYDQSSTDLMSNSSWLSINAGTNYSGFYTANFTINGTFTVNASTVLQLYNCEIYMGPNAKIVLAPNSLLNIQFCHIHGCSAMWDGIYTGNSTCFVKIEDCIIEDGINVMVSTNNGNWEESGSIFNKNYRSIVANNCTYSNSPMVLNNIYTCRNFNSAYSDPLIANRVTTIRTAYLNNPIHTANNFPYTVSNSLLPPYQTTRTYEAIELNNASVTGSQPILIGEYNQAPVYTYSNIFDYLDFGIRMNASQVSIAENLFENMQNVPHHPLLPINIAIYATEKISPPNNLYVGIHPTTSIDYPNKFYYCTGAVESHFYSNNIEHNQINNCNFGISLYDFEGLSQIVDNNQINNTGMAIQLNQANGYSSPTPLVDVSNNTIYCTTTVPANGADNGTRAIYLSGLSNLATNITVSNNYIYDPQIGIQARISNNIQILNNHIYFNSLAYTTSAPSPYYGIKLENTNYATIMDNGIKVNPTSIVINQALTLQLTGISVETSRNATVKHNAIQRMGEGIYATGSCTTSGFSCNDLDNCYYGFMFSAADIGSQLPVPLGAATGNNWTNIVNSTGWIKGTVNPPITWNWQGANPFFTSSVGGTITFPATASTISPGCTAPPPPTMAINSTNRELLFGPIVRNEKAFDTLSSEFKLRDSIFAYGSFKSDKNWLNLNDGNDALYHAFYDYCNVNSIGQFQEVKDTVVQQDALTALAINQNIPTKCTMDENQKTVNTIYLNHLKMSSTVEDPMFMYQYDSTETAILDGVAYQDPLLGGDAVYQARVMLFLDVLDLEMTLKSHINKPITIPNQTQYSLFPNPNNGLMQLNYSLADNETGIITIYNLLGVEISSYPLSKNSTSLAIDQSQLSNGIYFYKVIVNDRLIKSDKVIINK